MFQIHTQEARIILAIEAIYSSTKISVRKAAALYKVPLSTLSNRMNGKTPKAECRPPAQLLTESEEEVLIQKVLDLDDRGFAPSIPMVGDMANSLLAVRTKRRVGDRWAQRFVERRPELKTRFSRGYDFQRALCEDADALIAWFRLVENMRAKYGIQDCDLYNFDETGFAMGVIGGTIVVTGSERRGRRKKVQPGNREWSTAINCISGDGYSLPPFLLVKGSVHLANWYTESNIPHDWVIKPTPNGWTDHDTGVDWLRHFNHHTRSRSVGANRMIVLDSHESHVSADFEAYCKDHNIITISLPPHSSHLTQPLDVGIFSPLKRAYGAEINLFIRAHVNHITKVEFLSAYHTAYNKVISKKNIAGGFRGAGLIPHNPEAVISKLDVKLHTPEGSRPASAGSAAWESKTPQNSKEAVSQSTLVQSQISRHQGSSPTHIFSAVKQLAKGMEQMAHTVTLLQKEASDLRRANEALSKRRRAKKIQIRKGGSLTIGDAQDLIAQREVDEQISRDKRGNGGKRKPRTEGTRRCRTCGETGHNARTCQIVLSSSEESSEEDLE